MHLLHWNNRLWMQHNGIFKDLKCENPDDLFLTLFSSSVDLQCDSGFGQLAGFQKVLCCLYVLVSSVHRRWTSKCHQNCAMVKWYLGSIQKCPFQRCLYECEGDTAFIYVTSRGKREGINHFSVGAVVAAMVSKVLWRSFILNSKALH